MTLLIELAVNMKKINSITNITKEIQNLAEKYNSSLSYSDHEIEGIGHKILKHYYIFSLQFENLINDDYINLLKEIKIIKNVKIENIFNDNLKND